MVPGLNSYGRYILRTFYSGLTWESFHGASPLWVNENITGRSTGKLDPRNANFKITDGNVAVDAVGLAGNDWSYRVEQTVLSNDQTGGNLGNAWVGYNHLLNNTLHLRVGQFSRPVTSLFSNNWYRTGFSMTSVAVGNHTFALSSSGWGGEASYEGTNLVAEAGWWGQSSNLPNAQVFSTVPGTQRSFSWNVADAAPTRPIEIGAYGSRGTFTQTSAPGAVDQFSGVGFYVQRDAQYRTGLPGMAIIYQITGDSNPGLTSKKVQLPPGTSDAWAFQVEEPLFRGGAMVGARKEFINGFGKISNDSVFDVGFQVPHLPYLFAFGEATMGGYTTATFGRPTWRWALRWAGPVVGPLNKIEK